MVVHVQPHDQFRRQLDHLVLGQSVSVSEALLGVSVSRSLSISIFILSLPHSLALSFLHTHTHTHTLSLYFSLPLLSDHLCPVSVCIFRCCDFCCYDDPLSLLLQLQLVVEHVDGRQLHITTPDGLVCHHLSHYLFF